MVHAPYRGGPLALNDLIAGHIQLIIEVSPVVNEQVLLGHDQGLRGQQPVPPADAAGRADLRGGRRARASCVTGWLGIYGPPGMPDDVRDKLGAAIVEVVKQPEIADEAPRHRLRADRAGRARSSPPTTPPRSSAGSRSTPRSACGNSRRWRRPPAAPIVSLRGVGKVFGTGTRGARRARSRCARGRIPVAARAVRLRQVDGAAHHRGPERAVARHGRPGATARSARRGIGFVFQEPTLMPWATVFGNVFLPLKLAGVGQGRGRAAHHGDAGARRPCRLRARPIRASCPAACGCGCRSRARWSPRRAFC